jgi:hypothetical protein
MATAIVFLLRKRGAKTHGCIGDGDALPACGKPLANGRINPANPRYRQRHFMPTRNLAGKSHPKAIRALADTWIPILFRCEQERVPSARLSLSSSSTPHRNDGDRRFCQPELLEREPIRHLLIGSPTANNLFNP